MAQLLNKNGYHAQALLGGFNAWTKAGYPLQALAPEDRPPTTLAEQPVAISIGPQGPPVSPS